MKSRSIIVLGVSALWLNAALADARVELEIREVWPATLSAQGSAPIAYQDSIAFAGGMASAQANLDTGVLRAQAVAPGVSGAYASAVARIEDTLSFSAGSAGTAHLDWQFDGTISPATQHSVSSAALIVQVNGVRQTHMLTNGSCLSHLAAQSCAEGTAIARSGSLSFEFNANWTPTSVFLALGLWAGPSGDIDFSHTGRAFLRLPQGVGLTSSSGVFLASAAPITVVPEPATGWLWLAGLWAVAARLRARRRRFGG